MRRKCKQYTGHIIDSSRSFYGLESKLPFLRLISIIFLMQNEYRIVMITGLAIIMLEWRDRSVSGVPDIAGGNSDWKTTDGGCSGSDLYSHRTGGRMLLWTFKWISDSGA